MSNDAGTGSDNVISTIEASIPRSSNRCRSTTALPPSPYVPITSGSTSPIRTAESATTTLQSSLKLQERGVVRDQLDMPRRARLNRRNGVVHQRVVHPRVRQPHRKIRTALA